jgi:hypothetical protein
VGAAIEDVCGVAVGDGVAVACGVALGDDAANACGVTLGNGIADACCVVLEVVVADVCGAAPEEEQAASTVVSNKARMPIGRNLGMVVNIDYPLYRVYLPLSILSREVSGLQHHSEVLDRLFSILDR